MSSASRKNEAGPPPESASTTSSASSVATHTTSPTDLKTCSAVARCGAATGGGANRPVAAAPTSAGRLGMARTTATPGPHQACRVATRKPAATEMSSGPCAPHSPARAVSTPAASCGFTASTTTAAPLTAAALSALAVMPRSRASASRAAAMGSPTLMCSGRVPERSSPPMSARPMLPAPSMARRLLVMRPLLYGSWAKQRRPEAHDGRALKNRRFEVTAHAHRQRVEPGARGVERRRTLAQPREPCALARRLALFRWNAHQAAQREAREPCHRGGEGGELGGCDAALGAFLREVHLQADVEGRRVERALRGEALGDPEPVECVHPGEGFRDRAGLVGLHPPDEVPGELGIAQRGHLGQRLLQVALAEVLEAAAGRKGEPFRGLRLADGKECDRLRTPSGRGGGARHSFSHGGDALGQILRTH